jgi:putative redox protein
MAEMKVKLDYLDGMRFSAKTESGHEVIMDAGAEHGGQDLGPRPTELVLAGLGGCTAMDVISILKKKKQDVTGFEIKVEATRAEEHPKKFTDIHIEFVVRGRDVSQEAVERAVGLSMDKYCSVKATLEGVAKIGFAVKIENE